MATQIQTLNITNDLNQKYIVSLEKFQNDFIRKEHILNGKTKPQIIISKQNHRR